MFKVHHKETPTAFNKLFTKNSDIHSYATRQASQLHVPNAKTNYMRRAISVKGVSIWNTIVSQKINYDCSLLSFKISLKKYIMNNPNIVTYIC